MIEVEIRWNGFYIGPICFNELAMLLDITNYYLALFHEQFTIGFMVMTFIYIYIYLQHCRAANWKPFFKNLSLVSKHNLLSAGACFSLGACFHEQSLNM